MTDTAILQARYDAFCALGLHLDMSRGKPEPRQLDLSLPMLRMTDAGFACEDGVDARNYGDPTGIPEAKRLFGALLGMPPEQVIVGGNSSVNLIYDALVRAILHGPLPGGDGLALGEDGALVQDALDIRLEVGGGGKALSGKVRRGRGAEADVLAAGPVF